MRAIRVFLIAAGVFVLLGAALTVDAVAARPRAETFTIPAGGHWHVVLELTAPAGGVLTGSFDATGAVHVFIFTEEQYGTFVAGRPAEVLLVLVGHEGDFSFRAPAEGTYFLTFTHGRGLEAYEQRVHLDWRIVGVYPLLLAVGIASLAVGVELGFGGYKLRSRARRLPVRSPPTGGS